MMGREIGKGRGRGNDGVSLGNKNKKPLRIPGIKKEIVP
jgi:hypothetical protein